MSSFKNKKGGELSFTKSLAALTAKRASHKKMKTTAQEISYVSKSLYAGVGFLLAAGKEVSLKGADVSNTVIIKADIETGDEYSDQVFGAKFVKFASKVNKGKLNLGSKSRIATSRFVENVSGNDAIDLRIARLKDDDMKDEASLIKSTLKAAKKGFIDFDRKVVNREFIALSKLSNEDFLEQIEAKTADYLDSLTVKP